MGDRIQLTAPNRLPWGGPAYDFATELRLWKLECQTVSAKSVFARCLHVPQRRCGSWPNQLPQPGLIASGGFLGYLEVELPSDHSREDLIQFLRAEYITFPDANEQIVDILGKGDKVAVRVRFRGPQAGILGT